MNIRPSLSPNVSFRGENSIPEEKNILFNSEKSKVRAVLDWFCTELKDKNGATITHDVLCLADECKNKIDITKADIENLDFSKIGLAKFKTPLTRLDKAMFHGPNVHGAFIASCYLINTKRSKDIPEERKTPLIINSIINASLSVAASYSIMGMTKGLKDSFVTKVFNEAKKMPYDKSLLSKMPDHAGFVYNIFISCLLFRYITPVIATPMADKVNKFLIKHNLIKTAKPEPTPITAQAINSDWFKKLNK